MKNTINISHAIAILLLIFSVGDLFSQSIPTKEKLVSHFGFEQNAIVSEDESAPIESFYLIPLEFARLGKSNLTYEVCVGCDHGFKIKKKRRKRSGVRFL